MSIRREVEYTDDGKVLPWPANDDQDGYGPCYTRGRFSFWANPSEWLLGFVVDRNPGDRSFVRLHVGPFWFTFETTVG